MSFEYAVFKIHDRTAQKQWMRFAEVKDTII